MVRADTKGRPRGSKPTGKLKDLADTKKVHTAFLGDVQAHVLSESLKPNDRRQDIIHPSEMAKKDWCPRNTYYRISGTPETDPHSKAFSFQMQNIFAEGNSIHSKWQQWAWDMGRLWGHWKCLACDSKFYWTSPTFCPQCDKVGTVVYDEVPLNAINDFLIAGHADGAIEDIHSLLEIKSIGIGSLRMEEPGLLSQYQVETTDGKKIYDLDALWNGLRRPLASHVRQANLYLWLCQQMGLQYDQMVFLYEFKANQSFKEFTIKLSSDIVDPLIEKALDVRSHLKEGTPPERPDFVEDQTASCCKTCPWLSECWGTGDTGQKATGEPNTGYEREDHGVQAKARATRHNDADKAGVRAPVSTGRHYLPGRRGSDELVPEVNSVAGVDRGSASSSGGGRKVRRVHTRSGQGL